jgi:hypothetical protein
MQQIDRNKLSQYVEQSISHEENPESFRFQMDSEIEKYIKQHEERLKEAHSKMRV